MPHIDRERLRTFAEDGYVVLSQVVPPDLVQAARRAVANHMEQAPPPAGHRGPHSYLLIDDLPQALLAPLYDSPATDQSRENAGNLWVWPGSHRRAAAYLRELGPDTLPSSIPYPPVDLDQPRQVTGRAGDLLLAHYMLGHNSGGNTSAAMREVLYFRLRRAGHRARWREIVQDTLLEFEPVRAALSAR